MLARSDASLLRFLLALLVTSVALTAAAATATNLVPSTAPHGARALVVGSGLDAADAGVAFTAAGGNRAPAVIVSRTATTLELIVPLTTATGPVQLTVNGVALAPLPFTLAPDPPYTRVATLTASDKAHDVLKSPSHVAVETSTGIIIVADTAHHRILAVASSGTVTILAGTGAPGFADGAGISAQFNAPRGVAVDDAQHRIYIADTGNNVIRVVTYEGIVATLAGSGRPDDGVGSGSSASFKQPVGIATDALGNIYVADTGNSKIKLVTPAGAVSAFAGAGHEGLADGSAQRALFKQPEGIVVSPSGALYIADTKNSVIRKIENGIVSTIAGTGHEGFVDGAAASAEFKQPSDVAVDESGNVWIADTQNSAIRVIRFADLAVSTFAGAGKAGYVDGAPATALFNVPTGVAFAGVLVVADSGNDALRVIYPEVHVSAVAPKAGPLAGGDPVRIFGTGFVPGATQVTFGAASAASVTFVTSTELLVVTPPGTSGSVDVTVTTPASHDVLPSGYSYVPPPTIASLGPVKGKTAGGDTVTIIGSNFVADTDTSVSFGGSPATAVTVASSTMLTAVTPPGTAGPVDVVITTIGGTVTKAAAFTYFAPPVIASFAPAQGGIGTTVAITGQNFDPDAAGDQVLFGSVAAPVAVATPAQLIVSVPSGAATGKITVATAGGTAVSTNDFVVASITALRITAPTLSLLIGQSQQFNALGTMLDGTSVDVTAKAAWTSSNGQIVSVASTGVVTGNAAGSADITASFGGFTATVHVTSAAFVLPPDPSTVASSIDPTVTTSFAESTAFLYTGAGAVQRDVAPGAIDTQRVTVLRGLVQDRNGAPLAGARVSILGQDRFGYTLTRLDGRFDLAVNGGGFVVVSIDKSGYIAVQRQVATRWLLFNEMPAVILVAYDGASTHVDAGAAEAQIARATSVTDSDGSRRATLVFPAGTTATMRMPDGSTRSLPSLTVRATEYTVGANGPKAMPATLPPQSGYTYCVELSADEAVAAGATSVDFSAPVSFYVENFVGFRVGSIVPTGYYDRVKGQWIPAQNGRVIAITSVAAGLASLDIDGSGAAASDAALAALGVTTGELQRLAETYTTGTQLWRVPIAHFSPWDCNWPYGPPSGAAAPNVPSARSADHHTPNPSCSTGSIIECETQTLGERLDVTGTPFSLHYRSDRATGRIGANTVLMSLSGATLPPNVLRIDVEVDVAGQHHTESFVPAPNLPFSWTWDGQDTYGRTLQGSQPASARVGYVYRAVYQEPAQQDKAFAAFSGIPISTARARTEITLWQQNELRIGQWTPAVAALGGWTLSVHHAYDPVARKVYFGDGGSRDSAAAGSIIKSITDQGSSYMAIAPDGTIYSVYNGDSVARIALDGTATILAGGGTSRADGIPATQARLIWPQYIALLPDGSFIFADHPDNDPTGTALPTMIKRVDPNGIISRVATDAAISVLGLAAGPDASIYFAQYPNRIKRIAPDGAVSTLAGTGAEGFSGDGGPAVNATLSGPNNLRVGPDGSVYVVDWYNHRLRRIRPDGTITTAAGCGWYCMPPAYRNTDGDGLPATQVELGYFKDVAVRPDGSIDIAASDEFKIRRIDPAGIMSTIGGGGNFHNQDDGRLATDTFINPSAVGASPDGSVILFAGKMCRILPALPALSLSEISIPSTNGSEIFVFDGRGRHLRTLDAMTGAARYRFVYDNAERLTQVIDIDGKVTKIEHDAAGNPTAIVAPGGQRTTLTTDGNGSLASAANPAGETTRFIYTSAGLMTNMTTPRNFGYTFEYDALGRLARDRDPAGGVKTLTPNEQATTGSNGITLSLGTALGAMRTYFSEELATGIFHNVKQSRGLTLTTTTQTNGTESTMTASGLTTTLSTQPDARFGVAAALPTLSVRVPSGASLDISQARSVTLGNAAHPLGISQLVTTTTVDGRTSRETYNAAAQTVTTTSAAGRQTVVSIDSVGRPLRVAVPGLFPVDATYDNGLLKSVIEGTRQTLFAYDAQRRLASVTDALGRTRRYEYDGADRLVKLTLESGRDISYQYDADGNLTSVTPPGSGAHQFNFSAVDLKESYTPPGGSGAVAYEWDADRRLSKVTRAGGASLSFGYDANSRLQTVTSPLGDYQLTYDADANVTAMSGPDGENLNFTFNGPLPTKTQWSGPVSGAVNFSYGTSLRPASENVNGLLSIAYTFDSDGYLTSAGAAAIGRSAQNGSMTSLTVGSMAEAYTYDQYGDVATDNVTLNGAPVFGATYTRDALGRIAEETQSLYGGPLTTAFTYDTAGRLTRAATGGGDTRSYTYDANGNRLTRTTGTTTETAAYDEQDRLISFGNTSFTWADSGELKTRTDASGTTAYTYDVLGNLRKVALPDGRMIDYVIDAANHRVGKRIDGALVQGWLFAADTRIVAELDASNQVVSRFVYGSRGNVPDYMVRAGSTYRIIYDFRGSPRLVVNSATGAVAQEIGYDEFGNVLFDSAPGFQPFGFAGGLYDPDTHLIRFGVRDYDPTTGRWTAKDPIGFEGGDSDLYAYAGNDPVNFIDPTGLDALTSDPHALAIMASLFRGKALAGLTPYEQNALILRNPTTGQYTCHMLPSSHEANKNSFKYTAQATAVAYIHTHPKGRVPEADQGDDPAAARKMNLPLYALSRDGIHKYDPKDPHPHDTEEVNDRTYRQNNNGQNWYDYKDTDNCGCH